jgi:hypothetical protein
VWFRQFWGAAKRANLVTSLAVENFNEQYEQTAPQENNRYSFKPLHVSENYFSWPTVVSLCQVLPISGLQEMRRGSLMSFDRTVLDRRMRQYFDRALDWDEIVRMEAGPTKKGGRFDAKRTRSKVLAAESFDPGQIIRYALYPFDSRWAYFSATRPLWNEPRPALAAQRWPGNQFFITRMFAERPDEQIVMTMTPCLPDYHLLRPNAVAIPIRLRNVPETRPKKRDDGNGEFDSIVAESTPAYGAGDSRITANLSKAARAYLRKVGINNPDTDAAKAALIWLHALAIGYTPAYLAENGDGIRQDWPRIPLPNSQTTLLASADLGREVAALLDTETPLPGVDAGKIRSDLVRIAVVTRSSAETLNLSLTAGWGHAGKGGVTMPGKGKLVTRDYATDEEPVSEAKVLLGPSTHDVYLNNAACWKNIPINVWEYTIGGYQVLKKWLSYREHELLGRALTADEAREVTHNARRIAALLLLQPKLDQNYAAVKETAASWSDFTAME